MKNSTRVAVIAALLVVQLLAVGWLILRYERIVSNGVECRFPCRGYDPHDPFRGRFVRLDVRASCDGVPGIDAHMRSEVWLRIDPTGGTNSLSRIVEAAKEPSAEGVWVKFPPHAITESNILSWHEQKADESDEDFQKRQSEAGSTYSVQLPNQFFMNEKLAPEADKLIRADGATPIAVYRVKDGEIVLVNIEIDGKPLAESIRSRP